MIIKIWQYRSQAKNLVGGGAQQARSFDVALGCSAYILNIEAPSVGNEAYRTAERVGDYATADSEAGSVGHGQHRILDRYTDNLVSDDLNEQVSELAVHAGAAGLENVWHLTWSHHPDEAVDPGIMRKERQTIRRILGIQDCPGVGAYHGDEDHDHGHDLTVSIDPATGDSVKLGEYWWKEAAQIACAVCVYEHDLKAEPNRRYVADSTGVYHTFSDRRVAEADGSFVRGDDGKADHRVIKAIQKEHAEVFEDNSTPDGEVSGAQWPMTKAVKVLAAPRIKKAKTWREVHRNLARGGFRYKKVGNTGVLEAVQHGSKREDREIAAGDAYANAALRKLSKRLNQKYEPPPDDLFVPDFIMPRYEKVADSSKVVTKAEKRTLKSEAKKIDEHLRADNRTRQHDAKKDGYKSYNEQVSRRAAVSEIEQEFARDFSIGIGARPRRRKPLTRQNTKSAAKPLNAAYFASIIWSAFRSREVQRRDKAAAKLKRRYRVVQNLGRTEYWDGDRLAFIETQNLIAIRSSARKAKIDALRLAKAKLSTVRVFGKADAIADTVFLAAELGLQLENHQMEAGEKHKERLNDDRNRSLVRRHDVWSRIKPKLRSLLQEKLVDRSRRRSQANEFDSKTISRSETANAVAQESEKHQHGGTTQLGDARKMLNTIDRNTLMLASSRIERGSYRYLDDPVLLQKFAETPQELLLPELQRRLEAIDRVQQEQRKWVCAATLNGRITVADGKVETSHPEDRWVPAFYKQQSSDPTFRRLMMVSQLRPDRFQLDPDIPPEIVAWREARSTDDLSMAAYIADELHLRTRTNRQDRNSGSEERDRMFAAIPNEAQALRDTAGTFHSEYSSRTYRRPDETDKQWSRRQAIIKQNNRQR